MKLLLTTRKGQLKFIEHNEEKELENLTLAGRQEKQLITLN